MRLSWLVLSVTLYVSLDLANPLMPGALVFGFEDSVKARQPERLRSQDDAALVAATLLSERRGSVEHQPAVDRIPAGDINSTWRPAAPRARSSLSSSAPPSEDQPLTAAS